MKLSLRSLPNRPFRDSMIVFEIEGISSSNHKLHPFSLPQHLRKLRSLKMTETLSVQKTKPYRDWFCFAWELCQGFQLEEE